MKQILHVVIYVWVFIVSFPAAYAQCSFTATNPGTGLPYTITITMSQASQNVVGGNPDPLNSCIIQTTMNYSISFSEGSSIPAGNFYYLGGSLICGDNPSFNIGGTIGNRSGTVTANNGFYNVSCNQAQMMICGANLTIDMPGLNQTCMFTGTPLPLEMIEFVGETTTKGINLRWTTSEERENAGFEIQKSIDELSFVTIGFTEASKEKSIYKNYHFFDSQPFQGNNYYRLKQLDVNGDITYSAVISVKASSMVDDFVLLYPNPAVDVIKISGLTQGLAKVSDATGRVMGVFDLSAIDGLIDIHSWPKGFYTITVFQNKDGKMQSAAFTK